MISWVPILSLFCMGGQPAWADCMQLQRKVGLGTVVSESMYRIAKVEAAADDDAFPVRECETYQSAALETNLKASTH